MENFKFSSKLERFPGEVGWFYVYLPAKLSNTIHNDYKEYFRGFGSLRCRLKCGGSKWQSSIFWDSKAKKFILFIKAEIRKAENIALGDTLNIDLKLIISELEH